jgi:O-methyltransferase
MIIADLIDELLPYTKQSRRRLECLAETLGVLDHQQIEGDVIECGVWRGASIILARLISPQRVCWMFDTFDGMTLPDRERDISANYISGWGSYQTKTTNGRKWAACPLEDVVINLQRFGAYDPGKIRAVIGDVCKTLKFEAALPQRIALLRLDTDWYASTRAELMALYPRLVSGGALIIDDYGHWLGARAAVNEYFRLEPTGHPHWRSFTQIDETAIMWIKRPE